MWTISVVIAIGGCFFVSFQVVDGLFVDDFTSGGCVRARLCCPGKDLTCSVYERLTEDAPHTRCFCDSDCLATRDCCHDYQDYCQPVDCRLDETWQKWGKCSVPCGIGIRNRTRRIVRYPRNGGKECESTMQFGVCEGVNCKIPRAPSATARKLKEIALILPRSVSRWRNDSTYNDFRRNQQVKGRFSFRSLNGPSRDSDNYCAIYRVTEVGRLCTAPTTTLTNWTTDLVSGMVICVECQPTAVSPSGGDRCQGDGVYARQTRWAALTVPGCKGKWTMIAKPRECRCIGGQVHQDGQKDIHSQKNYIFV